MSQILNYLREDFLKYASSEKSKILARFFKTAPGEYGEGDKFLGIIVPDIRRVAKKYYEKLELDMVQCLISSGFHEERLLGLIILILKYKKSTDKYKKNIFNFYLKNIKYINNWDLVDITAPHIVGNFLADKDKNVLYSLAKSKNLWARRIAILSTFFDIRQEKFDEALKISDVLLNDKEDLIHKAVGWMLREIGKRDKKKLEKFLQPRYKNMPRVMLRYAIEHFPYEERKKYLLGSIPCKD
ncbi:DNA alkylation repair protein [Candidatus Omnitrophus magneticus]|uniref:DNA alkylation repair protein n=1 Tax=Candidatus Omnitrophus magneticus TaxID=1609969 RepID=A0A0F0CLP6_9BACT|nr:DNA alkylation repair protein [Candidatus Omnitrophus magneticus]